MMDDILDVITTRKSIRKYKPDPISDDVIDKILEAETGGLTVFNNIRVQKR